MTAIGVKNRNNDLGDIDVIAFDKQNYPFANSLYYKLEEQGLYKSTITHRLALVYNRR